MLPTPCNVPRAPSPHPHSVKLSVPSQRTLSLSRVDSQLLAKALLLFSGCTLRSQKIIGPMLRHDLHRCVVVHKLRQENTDRWGGQLQLQLALKRRSRLIKMLLIRNDASVYKSLVAGKAWHACLHRL